MKITRVCELYINQIFVPNQGVSKKKGLRLGNN